MTASLAKGGAVIAAVAAASSGEAALRARARSRSREWRRILSAAVTGLTLRTGVQSASEDGLVRVLDAATAASAKPVVVVLNAKCLVRRVSFFGPGAVGGWAATGFEGLSLWHAPSAQWGPRGATDYLVRVSAVTPAEAAAAVRAAGAHGPAAVVRARSTGRGK
ncbi:hypothetical protein JKP88DRAFT_288818 [Tribonema minus]|uniref:Uncharacterized protein n=1 Tax=Tribonema minus TaxID=303371 RepID=A0A836CI13_9STRA|nr:hypothetical protein JKP88DRAFT_288818 [Tribonema minus]